MPRKRHAAEQIIHKPQADRNHLPPPPASRLGTRCRVLGDRRVAGRIRYRDYRLATDDGSRLMTDDPRSMPFDQYQRYRLVANLLQTLGDEGRPLRVLHVTGTPRS